MTEGTNGSPLSWRDVYRAVEKSEDRIVAVVTDLGTRLSEKQAEHSRRLRTLEDLAIVNSTRQRSVVEMLGRGKTFLLLGFSATGATVALINFLLSH
jgi:hypothetical protein